MIIRQTKISDFTQIEVLVKRFFDESIGLFGFDISSENVLALIQHNYKTSFVAELEGAPIGIIGGVIETGVGTNDKIFHEVIWYVNEEYRRYGIKLLHHLEKWCRENEIKFVVMCNMGNLNDEKLERVYKSFGYKLFEKQYIKEVS